MLNTKNKITTNSIDHVFPKTMSLTFSLMYCRRKGEARKLSTGIEKNP